MQVAGNIDAQVIVCFRITPFPNEYQTSQPWKRERKYGGSKGNSSYSPHGRSTTTRLLASSTPPSDYNCMLHRGVPCLILCWRIHVAAVPDGISVEHISLEGDLHQHKRLEVYRVSGFVHIWRDSARAPEHHRREPGIRFLSLVCDRRMLLLMPCVALLLNLFQNIPGVTLAANSWIF